MEELSKSQNNYKPGDAFPVEESSALIGADNKALNLSFGREGAKKAEAKRNKAGAPAKRRSKVEEAIHRSKIDPRKLLKKRELAFFDNIRNNTVPYWKDDLHCGQKIFKDVDKSKLSKTNFNLIKKKLEAIKFLEKIRKYFGDYCQFLRDLRNLDSNTWAAVPDKHRQLFNRSLGGFPSTNCEFKAMKRDFMSRSMPFSHCDFRYANLEGSNFSGLHAIYALNDSSFSGANLKGAKFEAAEITRADFSAADLENASFEGVDNLDTVNFKDAHFKNTIINYSQLDKLDLTEKQKQGLLLFLRTMQSTSRGSICTLMVEKTFYIPYSELDSDKSKAILSLE